MMVLLLSGSLTAGVFFSTRNIQAATLTALCSWSISSTTTVADTTAEHNAGLYYWPDAPFSVIKNSSDYTFFGDDGGSHDGHDGSAVRLTGATLDNPLTSANGSGNPLIGSIQNMKHT